RRPPGSESVLRASEGSAAARASGTGPCGLAARRRPGSRATRRRGATLLRRAGPTPLLTQSPTAYPDGSPAPARRFKASNTDRNSVICLASPAASPLGLGRGRLSRPGKREAAAQRKIGRAHV